MPYKSDVASGISDVAYCTSEPPERLQIPEISAKRGPRKVGMKFA